MLDHILVINNKVEILKANIRGYLERIPKPREQTAAAVRPFVVKQEMSAEKGEHADNDGSPQTDASGEEFREDRYAWQNNMYDLLWMKTQGWVETYKDEDGRSWQADYVYVSASVLDKASSVEIVPVPVSGMMHNPVMVVLNI